MRPCTGRGGAGQRKGAMQVKSYETGQRLAVSGSFSGHFRGTGGAWRGFTRTGHLGLGRDGSDEVRWGREHYTLQRGIGCISREFLEHFGVQFRAF